MELQQTATTLQNIYMSGSPGFDGLVSRGPAEGEGGSAIMNNIDVLYLFM